MYVDILKLRHRWRGPYRSQSLMDGDPSVTINETGVCGIPIMRFGEGGGGGIFAPLAEQFNSIANVLERTSVGQCIM